MNSDESKKTVKAEEIGKQKSWSEVCPCGSEALMLDRSVAACGEVSVILASYLPADSSTARSCLAKYH